MNISRFLGAFQNHRRAKAEKKVLVLCAAYPDEYSWKALNYVNINEVYVYPPKYNYRLYCNSARKERKSMYDDLKPSVWRSYFLKIKQKLHFVFVNEFLYHDIRHYVGIL